MLALIQSPFRRQQTNKCFEGLGFGPFSIQILQAVFQPKIALRLYVISNRMLSPFSVKVSPDQSMSVREIYAPNLIFIDLYPPVCTLHLH